MKLHQITACYKSLLGFLFNFLERNWTFSHRLQSKGYQSLVCTGSWQWGWLKKYFMNDHISLVCLRKYINKNITSFRWTTSLVKLAMKQTTFMCSSFHCFSVLCSSELAMYCGQTGVTSKSNMSNFSCKQICGNLSKLLQKFYLTWP